MRKHKGYNEVGSRPGCSYRSVPITLDGRIRFSRALNPVFPRVGPDFFEGWTKFSRGPNPDPKMNLYPDPQLRSPGCRGRNVNKQKAAGRK